MNVVKKLTDELITDLVKEAQFRLKPKELTAYKTLLSIMKNHGTIEDGSGFLTLSSSSNRLKFSMSVSKATANRYINKMIQQQLIFRRKGRYKEASTYYIIDVSQKNETLVLNTLYDSINSTNKDVHLSLVYDQYDYLKDYDRKEYFIVRGVTYTCAEVRNLMSYLTPEILEQYASKLPEHVNKQYIINGLFFEAVKEQKKNKKLERKNTAPYTMSDAKEDYGYDILLQEIPAQSCIINTMMEIICEAKNSISDTIRLGKNRSVRTSEFLARIELLEVETFKRIIEEYNEKKVYSPILFLKNLLFDVPKTLDLEYENDYYGYYAESNYC